MYLPPSLVKRGGEEGTKAFLRESFVPELEEPEQPVSELGCILGCISCEMAINEGFKETLVLRGEVGNGGEAFLFGVTFAGSDQEGHAGDQGYRVLVCVLVPEKDLSNA